MNEVKEEPDLVEKLMEKLVREYRNSSEVIPGFFIVSGDEIAVVQFPPSALNSNREKDMISSAMKKMITERQGEGKNIDKIIFISEVYMLKLDKNDKKSIQQAKEGGIARNDNSEDKVMISVETKDTVRTIIYDIVRDGDFSVISPTPEQDETLNKKDNQIESRFSFLN